MLRGLNWLVKYLFSLLRVFSILVIALFLPRLYLWHTELPQDIVTHSQSDKFKLGIENLSDNLFKWFKAGQKEAKLAIGLITNQTGTDQEGNYNIDILAQNGLTVKKILMPQGSDYKNELAQSNRQMPKIPIIVSGAKGNYDLFSKKVLRDINVLMFDMQDSGVRYYGYVSMLLKAMQAAGVYNKKFVVLDRPNLLGWCMEGSSMSDAQLSSQSSVPLRHGMTIGELATYFNKHVLEKPIDLHVVPMEHYDRQNQARKPLACGLSRNINTIDSCYGYSFLGLLGEVAPFEIGIGTDKAFQCLLLPEHLKFPKQKWQELRLLLDDQGIESKPYRYYSSRKKEYCSGLRLYIHDINHFSSFKTLLSVLNFFNQSGLKLTFSKQFDASLGNDKVRSLLQGKVLPAQLAVQVNDDLQNFFKKAFNCFLYKPFPKILQV
ncbi:MAG: DUF1343 domain-containing protein [Candidatus Babeliales bacterium]|nr:DUF1343 domain-containing protein [Candidatus Babeliales bacterium]